MLLVEPDVPLDGDPLLPLRLPHGPVVVRLHLQQGREDRVVLVPVLVHHLHRLDLLVLEPVLEVLHRARRVRLPHVLQLDDLGDAHGAGPPQIPVVGLPHQPRQQALVLQQRLPLGQVPVHVLQGLVVEAGLAAQQHDRRVRLRGHEPEQEDVLVPAVEALHDGVSVRGVRVQRHLLVLRLHQVVHDVAPGGPAPPVAEPLPAPRRAAPHHAVHRVHPAVRARVLRQLLLLLWRLPRLPGRQRPGPGQPPEACRGEGEGGGRLPRVVRRRTHLPPCPRLLVPPLRPAAPAGPGAQVQAPEPGGEVGGGRRQALHRRQALPGHRRYGHAGPGPRRAPQRGGPAGRHASSAVQVESSGRAGAPCRRRPGLPVWTGDSQRKTARTGWKSR